MDKITLDNEIQEELSRLKKQGRMQGVYYHTVVGKVSIPPKNLHIVAVSYEIEDRLETKLMLYDTMNTNRGFVGIDDKTLNETIGRMVLT